MMIFFFFLQYHYVNTSAEVAALGIHAGCNLELGSETYMDTIKAINRGLVTGKNLVFAVY